MENLQLALAAAKGARLEAIRQSHERASQLAALREGLEQEQSVLDLREDDILMQLKQEAAIIIQCIQTRQEELAKLVREDFAAQREKIAASLEQVISYGKDLDGVKEVLEDSDRCKEEDQLASIQKLEELLAASQHVEVPDLFHYDLTTRPFAAESYLGLLRALTATTFPKELIIPMMDLRHVIVNPSDYDARVEQQGILYYLGTTGKTRPFTNPCTTLMVSVSASVPLTFGSLETLLVPKRTLEDKKAASMRTKSQKGASITFDFGHKHRVNLKKYVLTHGHEDEHAALRSWRLLGSVDGSEWVVLDERRNNHALIGPYTSELFECQPSSSTLPDGARFLSLEISGPNAAGPDMWHIELSGIEFFGTIFTPRPSPTLK